MPDIDPQALAHMLPDADSFSSLLDELPIGVAVMKPDGTLLTVNKTYETLTGIDRERAVGLKCLHSLRCDYCVKGCPVMTGWDKTECTNVEANIVNRERSKHSCG